MDMNAATWRGEHILPITKKFRSAMRTRRGLTLSPAQVQELVRCGVYDTLTNLEAEEFKRQCLSLTPPSNTKATGSTKDETGSHPASGKLPASVDEALLTEALASAI
jgi:hypothetical protein